MKRKEFLAGLCFFLIMAATVAASTKEVPFSGNSETSRLAGLGKVWGVVKFFHPSMAAGTIDWDKALVETVPLVRAASTPAEYKAAIDHMLSFLKDPSTRTIGDVPGESSRPEKSSSQPQPESKPELSHPEEDIALLSARTHLMFTDPEKTGEFVKLAVEAAKSKTVILDLRRTDAAVGDEATSYYLYMAVNRAFVSALSGSFALPASRHLMYSGYPTQTGGSSGGYFSAFVTKGADRLTGFNKEGKASSWIILIDESCQPVAPLCAGLQIGGVATVIQEGPASGDAPGQIHPMELPDGITALIRTSEAVNPDGTSGLSPHLVFPKPATGAPDAAMEAALNIASGKTKVEKPLTQFMNPVPNFRPDNPYAEMADPSVEYRLMALFRFWTVIDNFFPYKHLLERPWEETLTEFVPRMIEASGGREYTLTVAEMVSRITDTHGFINSKDLREYFGTAFPPFEVKYVEGETVVTHILPEFKDKVQGIEVGDVILAVDGEDIAARRGRLGKYFAASTPQALLWRIHQNILGGSKDSVVRLRVRNRSGKIEELSLVRNSTAVRSSRTSPVFSVLPDGFGYVDLARLTVQQVPEAFEAIKNTKAVIFDMRGYPKGTAWSITPRLIEKSVAVAKFRRPEPHAVSLDWPSLVSFDQVIDPSPDWKYKGKVVVLINEEAISQAEHTCLFLEAAVGARFVGSPTNGANGDVTTMSLPGAIYVNFTGHDVRHADGGQLQRVGIQPHIPVKPTIAGIRAGKDEVLERAVAYLKKNK